MYELFQIDQYIALSQSLPRNIFSNNEAFRPLGNLRVLCKFLLGVSKPLQIILMGRQFRGLMAMDYLEIKKEVKNLILG